MIWKNPSDSSFYAKKRDEMLFTSYLTISFSSIVRFLCCPSASCCSLALFFTNITLAVRFFKIAGFTLKTVSCFDRLQSGIFFHIIQPRLHIRSTFLSVVSCISVSAALFVLRKVSFTFQSPFSIIILQSPHVSTMQSNRTVALGDKYRVLRCRN